MTTTSINYSALEQGYDLEINKLTPVLTKRQQITHELNQLQTLRDSNLYSTQQALLNSTTVSDDQLARQELDDIRSSINNTLQQVRTLVDELRYLADPSDPRVRAQVDATKNQVQQAIQDYYRSQTEFDRALREQVWRRYEIANPEASPEEVEHGVQQVLAGTQMVFQVQGARTRQAKDAQAAVMERSAAIRKIEQDLMALSELSQQVAELVRSHEPIVEKIEENAEETRLNYEKGNEKIGHAIVSARNARKYKWYILLVCILIIAIIVAICVGWCKSTNHC
ncbi:t-SNARE [Aspergillus novoparasiticus]|uniref:t-SNARE n=1 Tax=Aspergillus novoparasiticus TaxID=986946 RepID=A0A5N6EBI9_9EURO|nr:t-SNARE [Aspergillus novoparasiticus]